MNPFERIKSFDDNVKAVKLKLSGAGIQVVDEKAIPYGLRLNLKEGVESVPLSLYFGKKGFSLVAAGKAGALKTKLETLFDIAASAGSAVSDGAPLFVSGEKSTKPYGFEMLEGFEAGWIGTDESGKGDVFGPLVVAAVAVSPQIVAALESAGVRDCKQLTDKKVAELAAKIRQACQGRFQELALNPTRYNSLYATMKKEGKNLNHLMAWAHARVIEDLLEMVPCKYAIADKFADVRFIESKLMARGRAIVLVQKTHAENNIAVAAASILARDGFLRGMAALSDKFGMSFPKGAGPLVPVAIQRFVAEHGKQSLSEVGKIHFRTFEGVL